METQQEYKMTKHEWEIMLKELQKVFSIVRLLNEGNCVQAEYREVQI